MDPLVIPAAIVLLVWIAAARVAWRLGNADS